MKKIAELKIERWKIERIKSHPENPKTIPPKGSPKYDLLKASLQHSYFDTIVVNRRNDMLVSGHFRHAVLLDLGFTEVDVSVVDYDAAEHRARLLAANTILGEWDDAKLRVLSAEIDAELATLLDDTKTWFAQTDAPPSFAPEFASAQGQLDQKKKTVCPACGHKF